MKKERKRKRQMKWYKDGTDFLEKQLLTKIFSEEEKKEKQNNRSSQRLVTASRVTNQHFEKSKTPTTTLLLSYWNFLPLVRPNLEVMKFMGSVYCGKLHSIVYLFNCCKFNSTFKGSGNDTLREKALFNSETLLEVYKDTCMKFI